ncbi:MAG: Type III secretion ATP synthase HrcN [Firmicutes bacterium ADurb.Bin373]|nr:MAG: Type III secretion ATP synthase HrcN [Firmicutes bacterium ADurb.Bin373]
MLGSVSRLMPDITLKEHQAMAGKLRDLLAAYKKTEDLINIGAYVSGSNPRVDEAIAVYPRIVDFLRQDLYEYTEYSQTLELLKSIAGKGVTGNSQV